MWRYCIGPRNDSCRFRNSGAGLPTGLQGALGNDLSAIPLEDFIFEVMEIPRDYAKEFVVDRAKRWFHGCLSQLTSGYKAFPARSLSRRVAQPSIINTRSSSA